MKEENTKALESLSKTAHRSGILPIFLGVLIGFIGVINSSMQDILTGLFMFVVGYAFVKVSGRIKQILSNEQSS